MTSQTGQTLQYIYYRISQEGNQTIKFDQIIEYDMRNIFLEKSYTEWGGEASPKVFYKKSNLTIFLDQLSEVLSWLLLYA